MHMSQRHAGLQKLCQAGWPSQHSSVQYAVTMMARDPYERLR